MSDDKDRKLENVAAHLAITFDALRAACQFLPIPITLPGELAKLPDAVEAVCRTIEISDEQPMPERQQAQLCTACIHWLAGADLANIGAMTDGDYRLLAAEINLQYADETLIDLMIWLHDHQ